MIRVVVADDHEVVRGGFAGLLATQPDISVVGTAADGAEAVRVCGSSSPDVVLMDVRMPGMDGIEATRLLTASAAHPRVLILTTFDLDEYVYDAIRAGGTTLASLLKRAGVPRRRTIGGLRRASSACRRRWCGSTSSTRPLAR